ncbi:MAG: DUF6778 family protein [Pseudomonadota bacterium]
MTMFARIAAVACLAVLAACGGGAVETGTSANGWGLQDVKVRFGGDIGRTDKGTEYGSAFVWDGYSGGNRKKQVVGLFKSAMSDVAQTTLNGSTPVVMNIEVTYFHALTDESRLWCCGQHKIYANLAVTDAGSNAVLASEDGVYLGRIALGGIPGLIAVAAGRDQDTRIREGIADGISTWLSKY